jgi:hypothetical protein
MRTLSASLCLQLGVTRWRLRGARRNVLGFETGDHRRRDFDGAHANMKPDHRSDGLVTLCVNAKPVAQNCEFAGIRRSGDYEQTRSRG